MRRGKTLSAEEPEGFRREREVSAKLADETRGKRRTGCFSDGEVPSGEALCGVCGDADEARGETTIELGARAGEGGLGDGVVSWGAGEDKGDCGADGSVDHGRDELEDTTLRAGFSADLDLHLEDKGDA